MGVIVILIAIVVVIAGITVMITRSSAQARLTISCWWQDNIEPLFRPERALDGLKLQKEILRVAVPASTVLSVSGELRVIPKVTIELSDRDWSTLECSPLGFAQIVSDLEAELMRRLDGKAVASAKPIRMELVMAPWARPGRPRVSRSTDSRAFTSTPMPNRTANQTPSAPLSPTSDVALAKTDVMPAGLTGAAISTTMVAEPIPKTRQAPPLSPADLPRPVVAIKPTELSADAKLIPVTPADRAVDFATEDHLNQDGRRCWTIGRTSAVTIDHPEVSSAHAQFALAAGVWRVRDLDSTNGTFLNGKQVVESELLSGDEIRLGPTGPEYLFEIRRPTE
ncbi:MAG: FHA domain-containing protein [Acidimicrobiales bacterium]